MTGSVVLGPPSIRPATTTMYDWPAGFDPIAAGWRAIGDATTPGRFVGSTDPAQPGWLVMGPAQSAAIVSPEAWRPEQPIVVDVLFAAAWAASAQGRWCLGVALYESYPDTHPLYDKKYFGLYLAKDVPPSPNLGPNPAVIRITGNGPDDPANNEVGRWLRPSAEGVPHKLRISWQPVGGIAQGSVQFSVDNYDLPKVDGMTFLTPPRLWLAIGSVGEGTDNDGSLARGVLALTTVTGVRAGVAVARTSPNLDRVRALTGTAWGIANALDGLQSPFAAQLRDVVFGIEEEVGLRAKT